MEILICSIDKSQILTFWSLFYWCQTFSLYICYNPMWNYYYFYLKSFNIYLNNIWKKYLSNKTNSHAFTTAVTSAPFYSFVGIHLSSWHKFSSSWRILIILVMWVNCIISAFSTQNSNELFQLLHVWN